MEIGCQRSHPGTFVPRAFWRHCYRHEQGGSRSQFTPGWGPLQQQTRGVTLSAAFSGPPASPVASGGPLPPQKLEGLQPWQTYDPVSLGRRAALNEDMVQRLLELPGTTGLEELQARVGELATWKRQLGRGVLPRPDTLQWPAEPFASLFLDTLSRLEMPRFCRRYPALLDTLLKQMLALVHDFEEQMAAEEEEAARQPESSQQPPGAPRDDEEEDQSNPSEAQPGQPGEASEQQGEAGSSSADGKKELQIQMESMEMGENATKTLIDEAKLEEMRQKLAEELIDKFEEEWQPVTENLQEAAKAFDDLDGLMDGPNGFDLSNAVWKKTGWQEVGELRRKLADLPELRELVRSLGRAGGKGPLRRAPEQVSASKKALGVVRSPLQPEETRGLTRSGDLSRMLPFEAHLLAAGWPSTAEDGSRREGSAAARRLHMVRRVERNLISYERTGWLEDEPSRVTGRMEIRPAAEQGPIVVCLDTSGSMGGARETVAKAVALECMRGAHRQGRACYLYAFSGPGDVQEMELEVNTTSLPRLLDFLQHSFGGGTDVDRPLELSLQRLAKDEWNQADILMVTDGEISPPNDAIISGLQLAQNDYGLEVHGLIVGREVTEPMKQICTHTHLFKSWTVVGGSRSD